MTSPAEQVMAAALEADATAEAPLPASASATRPNKSVPVAVRLSPAEFQRLKNSPKG